MTPSQRAFASSKGKPMCPLLQTTIDKILALEGQAQRGNGQDLVALTFAGNERTGRLRWAVGGCWGCARDSAPPSAC